MTERHPEQPLAFSNGEAFIDNWIAGVSEALRLAAKDAHLLAYQAGTGVVYRRDGVVDIYPPDPAMYEDLIPPPFQEGQELPEPSLPY
ncbi:hypothetical protein [Candidatus Poriferisodalis sp.]|uniref:hypothetical protein n=1 Tax=Candidatus Poriferisodalis sp. TaxID=3101277 RepID=UPI003B5213C9